MRLPAVTEQRPIAWWLYVDLLTVGTNERNIISLLRIARSLLIFVSQVPSVLNLMAFMGKASQQARKTGPVKDSAALRICGADVRD